MAMLPLLPAIIASGKSGEALGAVADAMPTLAPVLSGAQTWTQLIDSLPALHKSGRFAQLGKDIYSLWTILDIELGDPAHMASVVAALKAAVPAGK